MVALLTLKLVIEEYFDRMIKQEQMENNESNSEQSKRMSLIASLVYSLQNNDEEKKGLSRNEIIHEKLFLLVAGVEKTATTAAWFIHSVSKNPHVQTKLKAELEENSYSLDRIDSFISLDAVVREVLRLHSPSTGTVRTLLTDDRLPGTGARLYKGDQVLILFYNLQWDKRY